MSRIETIGNATLYLGDCRDILPTLPKVDLVLTDPPYGIGKPIYRENKSNVAAAKRKDYGIDVTEWDLKQDDSIINSVIAKGINAILWGGNYFYVEPSPCWLIWDKNNGDNRFADAELAWTNLKKAVRLKKYTWNGMIQENMKQKEIRDHPTQKPVPVMEWCINLAPKATSTVADPFMGSGTTGVACANLGKTFYGIEREPKYFDIACQRIENAYRQQRLFA